MQGLGLNVLGNILALIAVAILGWLVSVILRLPFIYRQRRKLFQFLGITQDRQSFVVYLSTLFVTPGGSVDAHGTPRSFQGPAIPAAELAVLQPVSQLFLSPVLDGLPAQIRAWLGNKVHWTFRQLLPAFSGSPLKTKQVKPSNMLAVGSQFYNTAGELYAETENPFLKMEQVGPRMIIRVNKGSRGGDTFEQRPGSSDDLAIVEKLFDDTHKTTVFIAAGLGVLGTIGAVQYLVDNWMRLHKEFGTSPFAICLRFQDGASDPYAYKKPIELSRFR